MVPSWRLHKSACVIVNHQFEVMRCATQHLSKDQLVGRPPFNLTTPVHVAAMAVCCTLCKVCAASIEATRTLYMLSTMKATRRQPHELRHAALYVAQHTKTSTCLAHVLRTIRKSMLSRLPQMMRGLVRYDPCHSNCSFTSPPAARSWLVINCFSCWNLSHKYRF